MEFSIARSSAPLVRQLFGVLPNRASVMVFGLIPIVMAESPLHRACLCNLQLLPAALALVFFAWLLTLHPQAAGRTYAAYGGVYVVVALLWLWRVDGVAPTRWDILGGTICLLGMALIAFQPRTVAA